VPVTDEEGNSLPGGGEACAAVGFTPDNRHVIAALWDGRVLVFDVVTGDKVRQLPAVAGLKEVSTMALSPDGEWMALADRRDRFALRRARDGEVFARWELPGRDYPCVRFSADGAYLAVTGHAGVEVREVVTGAVADNVPGAAVSVAFDPTGRLLVVAQATGDVIVWDRYAGAILAKHDAPIAVESVTFTPDGRRVALTAASTGADDDEPATNRTVWLWEFDRTALASPTESVAEAAGLETYRQVCAMAARGAEAVAWLEQEVPAWLSQLAQPAATAAQVATWIGKLDDATFQTRKEATEQLRRLGPMARPTLRAALTNDLPVEARERIRDLLQHAETWSPLTVSPADLQLTRAVQVLRQINTAAARELLRNIAAGPADAHATRAAQAGR
jgi:dipeptidyl aminopeptidase/acylaminoacyl peptidase